MANLDDIRDYVKHSHPNAIYKNSNKYDVGTDKNFINELIDNLWYAYNEDSFQLPYADKSLTPPYLKNKAYDLMMLWNLSLLLKINSSNLIVKDKKVDTITAINSLVTFNTDNTLVIFYDSSSASHASLIMKFLKSFRNALAHGGFNKLKLLGKINTIYLAAESYDRCLTHGVQLAIRLIEKDDEGESYNALSVPSAIIDILSHNYSNLTDLFERNLELSGNVINGKTIMNCSIDGIDKNVIVYNLHKGEFDKKLFYIENNKIDEIKKLICDVIIRLISANEPITNVIFYLVNEQYNISKKAIEEECVSKIIGTNNKTDIENYMSIHSFSLYILNKKECFNL